MFRRFYIQKVLCSEVPMFRRSYIQIRSEGSMLRNPLFYVGTNLHLSVSGKLQCKITNYNLSLYLIRSKVRLASVSVSVCYVAVRTIVLSHHIVDFPGSRRMETAPTSIEVILRPTLVQSVML